MSDIYAENHQNDPAPDWQPQGSARGLPDGEQRRGSTGQLWEAKNGQWVRVPENLISERGRALILAAAILDRPSGDPDDDLAVLARQLNRAQEEIDNQTRELKHVRVVRP